MQVEDFANKVLGRRITKIVGRPEKHDSLIEITDIELDDGLIKIHLSGSGQIDIGDVWAEIEED